VSNLDRVVAMCLFATAVLGLARCSVERDALDHSTDLMDCAEACKHGGRAMHSYSDPDGCLCDRSSP
jgi:hypothetical protein